MIRRQTKLIAAALVAACSVWTGGVYAGPGSGPYGPFNTSGAYGGFGPYAPFVSRGLPIQQGLNTAYPLQEAPVEVAQTTTVTRCPGRVTRTTYVIRHSPDWGASNSVAVPVHYVQNVTVAIGAEGATTVPEPVAEQITTTTTRTYTTHRHISVGGSARATAGKRTVTMEHVHHHPSAVAERTEKRLEPVGERTRTTVTRVVTRTTEWRRINPAIAESELQPVAERTTSPASPTAETMINTDQRVGPPYPNADIDYNNPYR